MAGWISHSGSPGTDHSTNGAAVPMAGYSLLKAIPANARRNLIGVQNQSTDAVQVVRADLTGANLTSLILAAAATAGGEGGSWSSETFKGAISIYVPTANVGTDQVAAYED